MIKTGLIQTLIELYTQRDANNRGNIFQTAEYTVTFLKFLTTQISDFPELYDECILGTNMEPLLKYTIAVDRKNANIVISYAKFLDALAQCLLQRSKDLMLEKLESEKLDEQARNLKQASKAAKQALVEECIRQDTVRVMRTVKEQIDNLMEGLQVYKNAFESVASQLCSTGLQIVH